MPTSAGAETRAPWRLEAATSARHGTRPVGVGHTATGRRPDRRRGSAARVGAGHLAPQLRGVLPQSGRLLLE
jgi:hypothetical protein